MYTEKIIDIETNKETLRDYTPAEIAEVKKAQVEAQARVAETQKRDTARQSALAKLAALGLTEDEIAAL